jgi:hypothetical protein
MVVDPTTGDISLGDRVLLQQDSNTIVIPALGTQEYEDFDRRLSRDGEGFRTNAVA